VAKAFLDDLTFAEPFHSNSHLLHFDVIDLYADGKVEPINHLAEFVVADEGMAEVDADGMATVKDRPGDVVVLVGYRLLATEFRGTVPSGPALRELLCSRLP